MVAAGDQQGRIMLFEFQANGFELKLFFRMTIPGDGKISEAVHLLHTAGGQLANRSRDDRNGGVHITDEADALVDDVHTRGYAADAAHSHSMTARRIILLDVDDVILMEAHDLKMLERFERPVEVQFVNSYDDSTGTLRHVWFDSAAVAALRALPADVEINWLSSWLAVDRMNIEHLAELLDLQRVRIPDLGSVEPNRWGMDQSAADLGHWKTKVLRSIARENPDVPILWVDDQLSFGLVRQLNHPHLSVLAPAMSRGLTPESVQRIDRWCADPQPFMKFGNWDEDPLPLPN